MKWREAVVEIKFDTLGRYHREPDAEGWLTVNTHEVCVRSCDRGTSYVPYPCDGYLRLPRRPATKLWLPLRYTADGKRYERFPWPNMGLLILDVWPKVTANELSSAELAYTKFISSLHDTDSVNFARTLPLWSASILAIRWLQRSNRWWSLGSAAYQVKRMREVKERDDCQWTDHFRRPWSKVAHFTPSACSLNRCGSRVASMSLVKLRRDRGRCLPSRRFGRKQHFLKIV